MLSTTGKFIQICYADDDPDEHYLFSFALQGISNRITLHSFESCRELMLHLNDLDKVIPDIVFLDINMPGSPGNECLTVFKSLERLSNVPVILFSTSADPAMIEKVLASGASKYVLKGESIDETRDTIRQLLKEFKLFD